MGPRMESHICGLLDVMFSAGLSPTLVEALEKITIRYGTVVYLLSRVIVVIKYEEFTFQFDFSIPSMLPTIQVRLLSCISNVLSKSHPPQARPPVAILSEFSGSALVQLALQTLARFNFKVLNGDCLI